PTNRFQYYIRYNEFTNINTCINIPITPATYTSISFGTQTGIYAHRLAIVNNTFQAGAGSNNYVNYAINMTYPTSYIPTVTNDFAQGNPYPKGITFEGNTITDVYRGIYMSGTTYIYTSVHDNNIQLRQDNLFSTSQHG